MNGITIALSIGAIICLVILIIITKERNDFKRELEDRKVDRDSQLKKQKSLVTENAYLVKQLSYMKDLSESTQKKERPAASSKAHTFRGHNPSSASTKNKINEEDNRRHDDSTDAMLNPLSPLYIGRTMTISNDDNSERGDRRNDSSSEIYDTRPEYTPSSYESRSHDNTPSYDSSPSSYDSGSSSSDSSSSFSSD